MSDNRERAGGSKYGQRSRFQRPEGARAAKSSSSGRLHTNGWKKNEKGEVDQEDDEGSCIICAEKIVVKAISPCNHTTCHTCTFRQRALYKKNACLICRTENDKVIFSDDLAEKLYSEYKISDFVKFDEKFGIEFTSHNAHDTTSELLTNRCPLCQEDLGGFKQLADHVKAEHDRFYCLICGYNKKAFISELKVYTYKQLQRHQQHGDEDGFEGHPSCKYCQGKRFYSEDELIIHIRENHERCFICDGMRGVITEDYYKDYEQLYRHFRSDHYVCTVPSCIEKRFVVFREDLDLTAHMLKEHGNIYNGSNKVVIGANYGGGQNGRYMSQLSTFPRAGASTTRPEDHQDTYDVKQMRLEERARHYLNYNSRELSDFLQVNTSYKAKKLSAKHVLDKYKLLFNGKENADISLLLFELSELFPENSPQRTDLSSVAEDYSKNQTQQEQFPALSSAPTYSLSSSWGGTSSGGKSNAAARESFPALSKPTPQPKLGSQKVKYVTVLKKGNTKVQVNTSQASSSYKPTYLDAPKKSTVSASSSSTSISSSSSSNWVSSSSYAQPKRTPPSTKTGLSNDAFPSLPTPAKKLPPRVNPITIDPKQWGKDVQDDDNVAILSATSNGGKKNKKKKQLLFHIGV